MTEYAVKGETRDGKTLTLRRGFASRYEAEEFPISWKRVWVEEIDSEESLGETGAPLPWHVVWRGNRTYVVDAAGRNVAFLLGTRARQQRVAQMIIDLTSS